MTIIENAAKEPHIVDLANFLNSMGADIRGAGTDVIKVRGVSYMHGITYSIIPDQIEAGTYMCAAAATRGCITITNITPKHLESISAKFREMGCKITEYDEALTIDATVKPLKRCNIKTMPHPGFPTDCQPQFTALLMGVPGTSIVNENVWDNRYQYISELIRMGAHISVEGRLAIIEGGTPLTAAPVKATDLRAGAAMIIAALQVSGTTEISSIQYIERGYEDVVDKFKALGADIKKVYFTGDNEDEMRA
jgi:UDP-N-acetylglucosamine 1-carboxyvinyltransferase